MKMSFSTQLKRSLWYKQKTELCKWLDAGIFWCLGYDLSKILLIFTSNGHWVVCEFKSSSNTENSLNSIISCHKVQFSSAWKICFLQKFNSNEEFQVFN